MKPSSHTKLLKEELLEIKSAFPYKFVDCSQSDNLSHSQNANSAFTIHSDLQILDQTWLSTPPVDRNTGLAGDWESYKDQMPTHRYGNSVLPKTERLEHGDPPLDLPFKYSDSRTNEFFRGESWFRQGKIKLPSCFEHDTTYGGNLINKIALDEGLTRKALHSAHGIFDLNSDMDFLLNELEDKNLQDVDWKVELVKFRNLLTTNRKALRRIILYASSSILESKSMAREIVLTRFEGKKQLKEALLCSDFGTPDLFGPLKAEMAENVKMYRTLNNRMEIDWTEKYVF